LSRVCLSSLRSWLHDGRDVLRVAAQLGRDRQGDPAAAVPPSTNRSARLLAELHRRYAAAAPWRLLVSLIINASATIGVQKRISLTHVFKIDTICPTLTQATFLCTRCISCPVGFTEKQDWTLTDDYKTGLGNFMFTWKTCNSFNVC